MTSAPKPRPQGWNIAVVLTFFLAGVPLLRAQTRAEHWVATWAVADVGRPQLSPQTGAQAAPSFVHFDRQTLRQIVRVSVGGSRVRVVLSNVFGTEPLAIGAVQVARRDRDAAVVVGSNRPLTFSGQTAPTIPPGAVLVSDPAALDVPPMADLAIDVYLAGATDVPSPLTMHNTALQTNYVSQPGDHTGATMFPVATTTQNWFVLERVEVEASDSVGVVVAFGDSITDGSRSTADTNNRWPNHLARRLLASSAPMAVVDAGIGGNRVLSNAAYQSGVNALARFDRDVLDQPGVTAVIVLEGINDIGAARENPSPSADDLIAAHKQLIERAHARGVAIFGATLTPFEGANYFTTEGERKRQAVNEWIRTGGAYDGVVDFDAATRDPNAPGRFRVDFDSGDHLHPSDAGYRAMGDAIDLTLFTRKPQSARR